MVPAGITAWRNGQRAIIPVGIQNRFKTWKEDTADSSERGMYRGTTIHQIPRRPYPRPFIIILNCSAASLPSPRSLFSHRTTVHPLPRFLDEFPGAPKSITPSSSLIPLSLQHTGASTRHHTQRPRQTVSLNGSSTLSRASMHPEMKPWARRRSASLFSVSSAFVTLLRRPLNPVLSEYVIIPVKPLAN